LWLRDRDIDIRCIRLRPYHYEGKHLIDVQQVIPLPEAQEYQVNLKEKEKEERKKRSERYEIRLKFWQGLIHTAKSKNTRHANIKPGSYSWLGASSGIRGLGFNYTVLQETSGVELYIDRHDKDENKRIYDAIKAKETQINLTFNDTLSWERLDSKRASRIKGVIAGGYCSSEEDWPEIHRQMVNMMMKLEEALLPVLKALTI
jgi:hypothetical protein